MRRRLYRHTFRVEFRPTESSGSWSDALLHYCIRCSTTARLKHEQCAYALHLYTTTWNRKAYASFKEKAIDFFSFCMTNDILSCYADAYLYYYMGFVGKFFVIDLSQISARRVGTYIYDRIWCRLYDIIGITQSWRCCNNFCEFHPVRVGIYKNNLNLWRKINL